MERPGRESFFAIINCLVGIKKYYADMFLRRKRSRRKGHTSAARDKKTGRSPRLLPVFLLWGIYMRPVSAMTRRNAEKMRQIRRNLSARGASRRTSVRRRSPSGSVSQEMTYFISVSLALLKSFAEIKKSFQYGENFFRFCESFQYDEIFSGA